MPPGRAWTPTGRFGWSISSSRLRQANGPIPFVWWPGNSDRAGPSGCGKTISGAVGCLPIRSAPTCCSWPTSHRPSWVVISRWVGLSRPGSWISTSSSGTEPTASLRPTDSACWER